MALSAGLALRKMLVARLKGDAALAALVGTRIHDAVPQNVAFPFIELSGLQEIDDAAACMARSVEVFLDLHVWSRPQGGPSTVEAERIGHELTRLVHLPATLPDLTDGWALAHLERRTLRTLTDPTARQRMSSSPSAR